MATNGKKPTETGTIDFASMLRQRSAAPPKTEKGFVDFASQLKQQPAAQPVLQATEPLVPFEQPQQVATVGGSQEFPR